MAEKFPFYKQLDAMDCGAACLKMITKYYGKNISIESIRDKSYINKIGVSILGISDAAESLSMHTLAAKLSFETLESEAPLPCIVYWKEKHFFIVYKIKKDKIYIADPAYDLVTLSKEDFLKGWIREDDTSEEKEGFALFLEPTPAFHEQEEESKDRIKSGIKYYLAYLLPYKKYYFQLFLSLFVATIIQLIFPFFTQALVDIGVSNQDMSFVYVILIAQIVLLLSGKLGDIIRSWLLQHITARINVSIISDFLIKLMKLPISFFDKKTPGDILQRIYDHERIQKFFTSSSVEFLFTCISIVVFGSILAFYNLTICLIYVLGSSIYFGWILFFMKKRKELDYKSFDLTILNQDKTIQLVHGMTEIKLQNCEKQKRWEWERIQARFYKLNLAKTALAQKLNIGAGTINELKNVLLTFYAATLVINGEMTLGMMIATQYIVGQLNWITSSILNFIQIYQDARISVERLSEIHEKDNEENEEILSKRIDLDPRDISIQNLSFQYDGPRSPIVLKNINLIIPKGKITAIVGTSGSGKTTLLKLLLKSYTATEGDIFFGETNIKNISFKEWRKLFACVSQDSFIFSDTIAKNIAIGEEIIDKERMKYATRMANIRSFIEELPLEYNTKLGTEGIGISQGQKQRLLIARAIYKNSDLLLLDEATNALDANNEKEIVDNLNEYFIGKTVVVIAHRLSTVKNADQIVVLEKGELIEIGNHQELVAKQGAYYNLVKNQLELGK